MTTEKAIEFGKIFLKTIADEKGSATYEFVEMAIKMMEQEPKTGHWIKKEKEFIAPSRFYPIKEIVSTCSICNAHYIGTHEDFKYCPNCGCRMKGVE
jgi:NADH pyrophosphatase NudC (nudix superfamily)